MAGKTKKGSKKGSRKATKKGLNNSYSVNEGSDLIGLNSFMKPHGKVVIIIKKAGCPHCDTLDNDIVKPLLNSPDRVHPIVEVQHDQVDNIDFLRGLTIMGYPAVYELVKKFGKGPETAAINEIEEPRNLENMKNIVSEPVSQPVSVPPSNTEKTLNTSNYEDIPLAPEAEEKQSVNLENKGGLEAVLNKSLSNLNKGNRVNKGNKGNKGNKANNMINAATPPPANNDMVLNSQDPKSASAVNDFTNVEGTTTKRSNNGTSEYNNIQAPPKNSKETVGGSLYASLLEASQQLAPVAILTTAAVASRLALRTKRSKRARRTRKN